MIGCDEPEFHEPRGDRQPAVGHSLIGVGVGDRHVVPDGLLASGSSGVTRLAGATADELAELPVPIPDRREQSVRATTARTQLVIKTLYRPGVDARCVQLTATCVCTSRRDLRASAGF